jgi:hypothetical protein
MQAQNRQFKYPRMKKIVKFKWAEAGFEFTGRGRRNLLPVGFDAADGLTGGELSPRFAQSMASGLISPFRANRFLAVTPIR